MELEIINKLYLELSQIATARTERDANLSRLPMDGRFWSIIKLLSVENKLLAIYLMRIVTNFGLSEAKEYVENIDTNKEKVLNPLQIWEKSTDVKN